MSRIASDDRETPLVRIDLDKMLRFAQWLFAEETHKQIHTEEEPKGDEPDGPSAA